MLYDMLIKEPTKEDFRQPRPNSNYFSYLEKSTNEYTKLNRDRINSYYNNLSLDIKKGIKRRWNYIHYKDTYFELFIHEQFHKLGCTLTEHPTMPNGKQPDYLVTNDKEEFYLECRNSRNISAEDAELQNIEKEILYKLSKLKSKYYIYHVKHLCVYDLIIPDLTQFLDDIQTQMRLEPTLNGIDSINYIHSKHQISDETIDICINLKLRNNWEKYESEEDELLGTHTGTTMIGLPISSIRYSLLSKLKKYGKTNLPLIVTLNVNHWRYCKKHIFDSMLFGNKVLCIYQNLDGSQIEENRRAKDGIFTCPKNKLSHVAGVLIVFQANPEMINMPELFYFKNPNFEGDQPQIMENFDSVELIDE